MIFFGFLFSFLNRHIKMKPFVLQKFHIINGFFLSKKRHFWLKNRHRPKKRLLYQNFISLKVLIYQKTSFLAKKITAGRKKYFFWIFVFVFKSSYQEETFLFLPKFLQQFWFSKNVIVGYINHLRPKKWLLKKNCFRF